jgi:transcription initiation factor TFIIIB Brf1 subunit/transcription initiation factor TFIIB
MKCPYCGSLNVVYDYIRGYIVCANCGTVIEDIFPEQLIGVPPKVEEEEISRNVRGALRSRSAKYNLRKLLKYEEEVKVYESYAKRCRRNVRVDVEALKTRLSGGKARVFVHVYDANLKELVEKDSIVKSLLEIIEGDPILSSRTFRGKVALALLLKELLINGEADTEEIAKVTGVSKVHMQRLTNILKIRIRNLKPKLVEIKKLISSTSTTAL